MQKFRDDKAELALRNGDRVSKIVQIVRKLV
jgi:hypothetical protein